MGAFLSVFENTELETPPLYPNITNQIVTKTLRLCNASCGLTRFNKLQFICLIGGRVCNPRQQHVVDIQNILLLPRVKNPPPN